MSGKACQELFQRIVVGGIGSQEPPVLSSVKGCVAEPITSRCGGERHWQSLIGKGALFY